MTKYKENDVRRRATNKISFSKYCADNNEMTFHRHCANMTGLRLLNPQKLVDEVLFRAQKFPRSSDPNEIIVFLSLYVMQEILFQSPFEHFAAAFSGSEEFHGNDHECRKMTESGTLSISSTFDHCLIYGHRESEIKKVRSYNGGKINLGCENLIRADTNRKYTKIQNRFTLYPISLIWPTIFSRNHNSLAEGLSKLNRNWNEEKLFKETRRLNIAVFQKIIHTNLCEVVLGKEIYEKYNPNLDSSVTLEFATVVSRFIQYYISPKMTLIDKANKVKTFLMSDTFDQVDLIEKRFNDALRGSMRTIEHFAGREVSINIKTLIEVK